MAGIVAEIGVVAARAGHAAGRQLQRVGDAAGVEVVGRGALAAALEARADEPDAAAAAARGVDAHTVDAPGAECLERGVLPDGRLEQQPLRPAVVVKCGTVGDGGAAAALDAAAHRAADGLEKERVVLIQKGAESGKVRFRRVDVCPPDIGREHREKARLACKGFLFRRRGIAVERPVERTGAAGCEEGRTLPVRQGKEAEHKVVFRRCAVPHTAPQRVEQIARPAAAALRA